MQKNIGAGYLYFYIHFVVEVICFYTLAKLLGDSIFLWIAPFMYDAFAFVPQSLIGYISDKYPKINIGIIGTILLLIGLITCNLHILGYIPLIILCLGNACLHVSGAETTLRASDGKLSHSAIFVAGGSFGVITGKLLGTLNFSYLFLVLLGLTMIPFILLADEYRKEADKENQPCKNFNYINKKINPFIIILLAIFVVIVRGYMGYGIPTSWNKTVFQTILLYFAMGTGKALGGILSDWIGIRKTAIISILLALPFLLFGDDLMLISLIGVLMFSMTMSITLAILVSVLKNKPGLAFGLTTIGLFLGTVPIFFIKLSKLYNCIVIAVFSIICIIIMLNILRKDEVK
ncbi:MAG: hypothetical protein ACI4OP_00420 [Candidatus Coprovivens sp.]